jgi:putative flippase GtrA
MEPQNNTKLPSRILAELLLAARFLLVGILATTIHIASVWILLSDTALPALMANTIAFVCSFGFSFLGNYFWTFGSPGSPGRAMRRFLTIAITAFFINTVLLGTILEFDWFNPILAAIGSAAIIPIITFFASRLWGFNYKNSLS